MIEICSEHDGYASCDKCDRLCESEALAIGYGWMAGTAAVNGFDHEAYKYGRMAAHFYNINMSIDIPF